MAEVRTYNDGETFWREVAEPLRARAVLNNVFLGVAHRIREDKSADLLRLGIFEGDTVLLGALRTPPHRLSLADLGNGEQGLVALVRHLLMQETAVPGVFGPTRLAEMFAVAWGTVAGRAVRVAEGHGRRQNLYQVVQVKPPAGVAGTMRAPRPDERDLMIEFETGFAKDAGLPPVERDPAFVTRLVDDGLSDGTFAMWDVGGAPVASARVRRIGTDGARVSGVYTPTALRGHGYAAALTAALSERVLAQGYFCCLFADADNALTNRLYRRIGYIQLATYADIVFSDG